MQVQLSRDWHSPHFNDEDHLLTNTYLNTLQKARKSPRTSMGNGEKAATKQPNVTWSKKVKNLIPVTTLSTSEVVKSIKGGPVSEIGTDFMTEQKESQGDQEDLKSVSTQKKPFKVILKSKSVKSFEDKSYDPLAANQHRAITPQMASNKHVSSDIMNVYASETKRPSTTGISESDSKFVRRNQSLSKDLVNKDLETTIKPFKLKEGKTPDKFRSVAESDTDRGRHIRGAKSELDKIKEQLNIHYGTVGQGQGNRLGSRSGKSLPEMSSTLYNPIERKPLNQLISAEDGLSQKETLSKVNRRAPVRPTNKVAFSYTDQIQGSKTDTAKRNMFNINNHGTANRATRGRQVQSADKQVEEKKPPGPAIHSTIRSIISTLDQRQLGITGGSIQTKKTKPRPSKYLIIRFGKNQKW